MQETLMILLSIQEGKKRACCTTLSPVFLSPILREFVTIVKVQEDTLDQPHFPWLADISVVVLLPWKIIDCYLSKNKIPIVDFFIDLFIIDRFM